MVFKQYRYEPLGAASYLVGCGRSREAFLVDPIVNLGVDFYVLEAADLGLKIAGVLETHIHADMVSCARAVSLLCDVPHYLHEAATVRYGFTPLHDGDVLQSGAVELRVLHTPGHTPEHVCYLVTDRGRSSGPWFVLSGDSLFVGDVGRPDLVYAGEVLDEARLADRAMAQYRSIRERLFALPGYVEVYPTHYGGSDCGGGHMNGKASTTIGFEKRYNRAMRARDAAAFVRFIRDTAKPLPADYRRIKAMNLGLEGGSPHVGASTR